MPTCLHRLILITSRLLHMYYLLVHALYWCIEAGSVHLRQVERRMQIHTYEVGYLPLCSMKVITCLTVFKNTSTINVRRVLPTEVHIPSLRKQTTTYICTCITCYHSLTPWYYTSMYMPCNIWINVGLDLLEEAIVRSLVVCYVL